MTLQKWREHGWLRIHAPSRQEIADLLGIVDRDLSDAKSGGISTDWQFGIAYNAALKLCSMPKDTGRARGCSIIAQSRRIIEFTDTPGKSYYVLGILRNSHRNSQHDSHSMPIKPVINSFSKPGYSLTAFYVRYNVSNLSSVLSAKNNYSSQG